MDTLFSSTIGLGMGEIGTHGFLDSDEFLSKDHWLKMPGSLPAMHNRNFFWPCSKETLRISQTQIEAFRIEPEPVIDGLEEGDETRNGKAEAMPFL